MLRLKPALGLLLVIVLLTTERSSVAAPNGNDAFLRTWTRTDQPVAASRHLSRRHLGRSGEPVLVGPGICRPR